MTGTIVYALVLFAHPGTEPKIFATFADAQQCRQERVQVLKDLGSSVIVAACVPQNQISIDEMSQKMQSMLQIMRQNMERSESK